MSMIGTGDYIPWGRVRSLVGKDEEKGEVAMGAGHGVEGWKGANGDF
jgi:hypothetical protein